LDQWRAQLSKKANTLQNYILDYIAFFDWLIAEGFFQGSRGDIPLEVLEGLRATDVERFGDFLAIEQGNSKDTIARKIASLKSLFHFLSQISEDESGYPYLKRNVMIKVEAEKEKVTIEKKAARNEDKILRDDEIFDFRLFVAEGFRNVCEGNKRILNSYKKTRSGI